MERKRKRKREGEKERKEKRKHLTAGERDDLSWGVSFETSHTYIQSDEVII